MKRFTIFTVVLMLAVGLFVGCGGESSDNDSAFPNTHKGAFYTISYPDGWEVVAEDMMGGETVQEIKKDGKEEDEMNFDMSVVTIQSMSDQKSKRGDVDALEAEMLEMSGEEAMEMMEFEKTTFAGEKALKMGMEFLVSIESYTIPMDGWRIMIGTVGGNDITSEILKTFKITDPNYSGSKDMMDFGGNTDDEDRVVFDDDFNWDEEEDEKEIDLAVGEEYTGEYFTMTIPEGLAVMDDQDPENIMFQGDEFMMIVACTEQEGYVWSDTDVLKEEMATEIESGEIYKVDDLELGINSAVWFEGINDDTEMEMVMIGVPMTDWAITIIGSNFKDDDAKAKFKSTVMTFDVTDMFYKGME